MGNCNTAEPTRTDILVFFDSHCRESAGSLSDTSCSVSLRFDSPTLCGTGSCREILSSRVIVNTGVILNQQRKAWLESKTFGVIAQNLHLI